MAGFGSKERTTGERRGASRQPLNAEIWADPGGTTPAIVCQARNVSAKGARISVHPGTQLPERFLLKIGQTTHQAKVVWRLGPQGSNIGVTFQNAAL